MKTPSPDDRQAILIARRNMKMAFSPHAYMRGNTSHYYEWLHSQHGHALPHGPAIWICGDCHHGNLGPLADSAGHVEVHIRDFDQTLIGNPAHDLLRLGLSLATAANGSNLSGVVTAHMLEHMMGGYAQAFASEEARIPMNKPEFIKIVIRSAAKRSWKQLAKERKLKTQPKIKLGKNFWPLSKSEKIGISDLFETPNMLNLVTTLKSRDDDAKIKVLDAAYWAKGCSSLGLLRYAVLLSVDDDDYCLIDIKEAVQAAAPRYQHAGMPHDNGRRVLEGAKHLSPSLGKRMIAARFLEHGVYIRELLPQDLKLEIEHMSVEEAIQMSSYLSFVVGTAHARQMDDKQRQSWLHELKLNRPKSLDTPAWLWKSIVQLMSRHEAGYLEHCRKYALGLAG